MISTYLMDYFLLASQSSPTALFSVFSKVQAGMLQLLKVQELSVIQYPTYQITDQKILS